MKSLSKIRNFCKKSQIVVGNPNISQKSQIFVKIQIFVKNRNPCQKFHIFVENRILSRKSNFSLPSNFFKLTLFQAVPNDRVLILTPVKTLGQSGSSKPMYQMVTGQKPHRTAFQTSSMTTSVIQTLQLQRQPTSQSGGGTTGGSSQTYVIKMNPNRLTEQAGTTGGRRPFSGGVIQAPTFGGRSPSHDACASDPYAQCMSCHKLYRLEQVKKINNEFRCVHCHKS